MVCVYVQASNWCQKSQVFLNSMEERGDVCDSSSEAASLLAELSAFVSVTKQEQLERVDQVMPWYCIDV